MTGALVGIDPVDLCDGNLTATGATREVPLRCPAWYALGIRRFWRGGNLLGGDQHIDGAHGDVAYRRWRTATSYSLPMFISGEVDESGDPAPAPTAAAVWSQLDANVLVLMTELVAKPNTLRGTRQFTLYRPSGAIQTAQVHVLDLLPGEDDAEGQGHFHRYTLELSIAAGGFQ